MLLQIVLPSTLEYIRAHEILKYMVRLWCVVVGKWLQLDTYLLSRRDREEMAGEPAEQNEPQPGQENQQQAPAPAQPQPNNLADRHQALLQAREAHEAEPYVRPDHFCLRLIALLVCVAITSILLSLILLVVPGM
jgi:hypothetical protein